MKIYSMTATFGKLDHETLTLTPGLNIIEAPNEWGKSTWCAFLVAMLYGMETRVKSTKTALADKERYAPWSGSPMAGRMEIHWNGRDITIERKNKGRVPLGDFKAYETESGLPVTELNAANCGEMLLGVERSVFQRAGFIRFSDLTVTQDENLRHRLNALVTTGDESGDGERLAKALKDLKNRCRYNRSGLLPQAEAEQTELSDTLRELESLEQQSDKIGERLAEVKDWTGKLENHKAALRYQAAEADAKRVAKAREDRHDAVERLEEADKICRALPSREETERNLSQLRKLNQAYLDIQMESTMAPEQPAQVEPPEVFRDMTGEEALAKAEADTARYAQWTRKNKIPAVLGVLLLVAGILAAFLYLVPGLIAAGAGLIVLIVTVAADSRRKKARLVLEGLYGSETPQQWIRQAQTYADDLEAAALASQKWQKNRGDLDQRIRDISTEIQRFTQGRGLEDCRRDWEGVIAAWDDWAAAMREAQRADNYWKTLRSMAKSAEEPRQPDDLTYTENETARLLSDAQAECSALESRLSQYQGRMEAMGDREALKRKLNAVTARIEKLEDTYAALTIAQETLAEASMDLQRRFAPKISKRAQELMTALTDGRYDRLSLGEDLGLQAGAGEEDTLHDSLWRSDGTVDQLYLALRLAVAEALTEDAPVILDDALVRFDDTRLKSALNILRQEAQKKQVILFTCQSREKDLCEIKEEVQ